MESEVKKLLDKENYIIGIPSRKRSFMIEKRTGVWKYFKKEFGVYPIKLFVREEEVEEYGNKIFNYNPHIWIEKVPNDSNIAQKRQAMLDYAIKNNVTYLFIIDDDINIYYREESLSSKYSNKMEEMNKRDAVNKSLYESVRLCNEEYPITGFPLKQGSQGRKYTFEIDSTILHFVCYHVPTLVKEEIRIDGLGTKFMSDRYVQLSMLSKGYKSMTNCRYAIGDYGTGYKGGCQATRTVQEQESAAKELVKIFPGSVELKHKENGIWNEPRLDCKINWKGFLKEGELKYLPKEEGLKMIGEI
jgi:hypothetical protein